MSYHGYDIDRRERLTDDDLTSIDVLLDAWKKGIAVGTPCIVEAFHADENTVDVVPVSKYERLDNGEEIDPPLLLHVPVCFIGGGGLFCVFPIQEGDECLVVFCDTSIDDWHELGGTRLPSMDRNHHLSDGVAIFGPRSKPNAINALSNDALEIRNKDGQTKISLNQKNEITIQSSGEMMIQSEKKITIQSKDGSSIFEMDPQGQKIMITGMNIEMNGNVTINGNVALGGGLSAVGGGDIQMSSSSGGDLKLQNMDISLDGLSIKQHKHGGVESGGGFTTPPTS